MLLLHPGQGSLPPLTPPERRWFCDWLLGTEWTSVRSLHRDCALNWTQQETCQLSTLDANCLQVCVPSTGFLSENSSLAWPRRRALSLALTLARPWEVPTQVSVRSTASASSCSPRGPSKGLGRHTRCLTPPHQKPHWGNFLALRQPSTQQGPVQAGNHGMRTQKACTWPRTGLLEH